MDTRSEMYSKAIGAQARAEIAAAGSNVKAVAEKTGISRSSLIKYLDGERSMPSSALYKIADVLGMTAKELSIRAWHRFQSMLPAAQVDELPAVSQVSDTNIDIEDIENLPHAAYPVTELPEDHTP